MLVPGTLGRPAYRLYQLAWAGLDWLYPPHCGGCEQPGSRWCQDCQNEVKLVSHPVCEYCGQILKAAGVCRSCQQFPPHYSAMRSWAVFDGPVRTALHRLKYNRDVALGEVLARPLIDQLNGLKWRVDLITPVPLGKTRRAQRGYNQAALLAWPLALGCGITYRPQALMKVRETRTQVGLTLTQRRENVAEAFRAKAAEVSGKRILVVDDVTTSGATMEACATALLSAGAERVYGLTLARAA